MDRNDIGPLISSESIKKIIQHIEDSKKGAKFYLVVINIIKEIFFEPTIISGISKNMKIFSNENFGPIIPLIKFEKDEEVIFKSNDTNYGLAAYFYTNNSKRVWKIINNLEYGMFGINSGKISTYLNPCGGLKESGIGREGSFQCLEPFLETKFISWNL